MQIDRRVLADRYELGERLGAGGMGEVRAARDVRLGRDVAVKLLRTDLAARAAMRARFESEAKLAAHVQHPSVVSVLDAGLTDDGHPFLVMERLSGRTLRDVLHEDSLDTPAVRALGVQVLGALEAAHALDVVHRDVKPGNVLEAGPGRWKVGDFGIAKWLQADETLTNTGEVIGSPSYLAPERLAGGAATPASDVYSVGVVLYEALSGRRPFEAEDPFVVAHQVREGTHPPLAELRPDLDAGFVAAVQRAMARDPADRWPSAAAFAAALRSGGEVTTVVASSAEEATVPLAAVAPAAVAGVDRTAELPVSVVDDEPIGVDDEPTAEHPVARRPERRMDRHRSPRIHARRGALTALLALALIGGLGAVVLLATASLGGSVVPTAQPAEHPGTVRLGHLLVPSLGDPAAEPAPEATPPPEQPEADQEPPGPPAGEGPGGKGEGKGNSADKADNGKKKGHDKG